MEALGSLDSAAGTATLWKLCDKLALEATSAVLYGKPAVGAPCATDSDWAPRCSVDSTAGKIPPSATLTVAHSGEL